MTIPPKAREWWIHKGSSNFCAELDWDEDYTEQNVKKRPDNFYDIVQTKDTIEGGIHVIEYAAYAEIKSSLDHKYKLLHDAWEEAKLCREENAALKEELERVNAASDCKMLLEKRVELEKERDRLQFNIAAFNKMEDEFIDASALLTDCEKALQRICNAGDKDACWVNNWDDIYKQAKETLTRLRERK